MPCPFSQPDAPCPLSKGATAVVNGACRLVEGATHGFTPCTACAKTPGGFGDTVGETFGYASDWLHKNYGD